ncbi:hypothetical protein R1flu_002765 [Riccia fluitans]|uniref:Cytochrome P450 n=1 Tax=Riccia fluitans TaxID=41844 RepID=A0ABD1Y729_9MARC
MQRRLGFKTQLIGSSQVKCKRGGDLRAIPRWPPESSQSRPGVASSTFRKMATGSLNEAVNGVISQLPLWGWVVLAVVTFLTIQIYNSVHLSSKLPPSPGAFPIVGSFPLMGAKDGEPGHQMFHRLSQKFGPLLYLRMGNKHTIIVSDANMAKIVLKDQDHIFASRPWMSAGKYMGMEFQSVVFAPSGPYYKKLRKIYTIELLSNKRVLASHAIREARLVGTVRSFYEDMEKGQATNLSSTLKILSLNSLMSMIFGVTDESVMQMVGKVPMEDVKDVVRCSVELGGEFNFGDFIPIVRWLDLQGVTKRMKALTERMRVMSAAILEAHREQAKLKGSSGLSAEPTILDVVLSLQGEDALTDEGLAGVIFDMIIAGSDTTAVSSDWTIAELLRKPHLLKKLRDELDSVVGKDRLVRESDLPNLPYLQCVIKESLRLHPPAPLGIPHCSTQKTVVAGYEIPANTTTLINLYTINRDPKNWTNPLEFTPERFENLNTSIFGQDYSLLPFSSGRRGCSGMLLGYTMVQLTVATLCHCFEFATQGVKESEIDVVTERAGLVSMRAHDIFVRVTPRLPSHLYK